MSLTLAEATIEAPANGIGVPTGDGNWRLAVQALVSTGGARVGKCRVDTAKVSTYEWYDLTSSVTSLDWSRGAAINQGVPRPNIGVLNMALDNTDHEFSPWNFNVGTKTSGSISNPEWNSEWAPRQTLIRVVMFQATASTSYSVDADGFSIITRTNWKPCFTGFVESWNEVVDHGGSNVIQAVVTETLGSLADVDKPAQASQGAGDELITRIKRLAYDAGWPFCIVAGNSPNYFSSTSPNLGAGYTLQATTMDSKRLAEIYLSGDSVQSTLIFSDTDGSLKVGYGNNVIPTNLLAGTLAYSGPIVRLTNSTATPPATDATTLPGTVTGYFQAPLTLSSDADFVINDVTFTRVGGTAQSSSTNDSIGKYGRRSVKRTDLIGTNDTMALYAGQLILSESDAWADPNIYGRVDQALQPSAVTLSDQQAAQRAVELLNVAYLDYYDGSTLAVRLIGRVAQTRDVIERTATGIKWATTIQLVPRFNYQP